MKNGNIVEMSSRKVYGCRIEYPSLSQVGIGNDDCPGSVKKASTDMICPNCGQIIKEGEMYIEETEFDKGYCGHCIVPDYETLLDGITVLYEQICLNWRAMFRCDRYGFETLRVMIINIAWSVEATLKVALLSEEMRSSEERGKAEIIKDYYSVRERLLLIMDTLCDDMAVERVIEDPDELASFIDSALDSFFDFDE